MIRTIAMVAFWAVYSLFAAIITFPLTILTGRSDVLWWFSTKGARAGLWLGNIQADAVWQEELDPERAYLFIANHASNIDPPVLAPLLGRHASFMLKKELYKLPILSTAFRICKFVPIARDDPRSAVESMRQAVRILKEGVSMFIFPEGTRSPDGRLLPFKKGPFNVAMHAGVAVVPVTIVGTHQIWPKHRFAIHSGKATVVFHKPIESSRVANQRELMRAVWQAINSALPQPYRAADDVSS